jgi:hypothetical protein
MASVSLKAARILNLTPAFIFLMLAGPVGAEDSAPGPATAPVLSQFSPENQKKLLAGEAIFEHVIAKDPDGKDEGHGRGAVLINRPVEECFRVFLDLDQQYRYFPRMTVSRVLGREGNRVRMYKELDFTIVTVKYTHFITIVPEDFRVDFITDPKGENSSKLSAGFFRFAKVNEKTSILFYEMTRLEIGFKVPEFIRAYATSHLSARDLPPIVTNIKKRIESGGTWEKNGH